MATASPMATTATTAPLPAAPSTSTSTSTAWSYEKAFCRNIGLVTEAEQQKLRDSRIAIAGMGGVGGIHLVTLARLGVGKFTIADPDAFDVSNTNRQYGATTSNCGRGKAETMAEICRDINPDIDIRIVPGYLDGTNADEFLRDADLFVDGLDFYAIDARRIVYRNAYNRGLYSITAGPVGFGTAWLVFAPEAMTFDQYFDLSDNLSQLDKIIAFAIGLAPKATHLPYTDLSRFSIETSDVTCCGFACHLASGVVGAESLKILLGRPGVRPVPCYQQFDAYRTRFASGRMPGGNRNPWQRLKRWWLTRRYLAARAGMQSAST